MTVQEIYKAVITYDIKRTSELVQAEIEKGTDINKILVEGLIAPLDEVGKKFSSGELFVPEMLSAAYATKEGLNYLKPLLAKAGPNKLGTILLGTVKGDLHDIGKNIVGLMLEGAGFEVVDLGTDVAPEKFMAKAKEINPKVIAMSALLTTTMPSMQATVDLINKELPGMKTMVGGAPVTEVFAKQIGADGYSVDAPGAVEVGRTMIQAG